MIKIVISNVQITLINCVIKKLVLINVPTTDFVIMGNVLVLMSIQEVIAVE